MPQRGGRRDNTGGARPGAGRPKGKPNSNSRNGLMQEAKAISSVTGNDFLPHEFLKMVARGEPIDHWIVDPETKRPKEVVYVPTFDQRIDAAKAAAPYFASKLAPKEVDGGSKTGITVILQGDDKNV